MAAWGEPAAAFNPAAAYHAPVPDDHAPFAPQVNRGLLVAGRFPGARPPACSRWPEPGKA